MPLGTAFDEARRLVEDAAIEAGRDPGAIGMDPQVSWRGSLHDLVTEINRWRQHGASHVSITTMGAGLPDVNEHLTVLAEIASELGLA